MEAFCFHRYIKLALNFAFVYILVFFTSFLRAGGLAGVYAAQGWKYGIMYIFIDMLGLSSYVPTPSLNETWWYMQVAILFVFLVPVFIKIYKAIGRTIVVFVAFLGFSSFVIPWDLSGAAFLLYLFCVVIGIWCAEENIFERCHHISFCKFKQMNHLIKIVISVFLFAFFVYLRIKVTTFNYWIDAIIPIPVCIFCMELSGLIPFSEKIMGFIGKHSMNMFLIHTIIFEYYFTEFIYSPKYWVLVLLLLSGTSLLGSVAIESLKKALCYPKVINFFILCIEKGKMNRC
ncbi:MAG: hypothetical protein HFG80_02245 [Eubacterium sp.]|nr:hypothetical protein [Eubacterium sp.]